MARKIAAIFGPTYRKAKGGKQERKVPKSILDCARDLGAKIAAHNIVLTGGEGPGECSVKDVAIAGAGSGPWIGVIQRGGLETECHNVGNGIVVPTELKHKRNFLEALMCDAAVAFMLPDGPGTRSEVACALALRRPVALVGKGWRALDLAGHGGPKQVADLFEEAREYLDESTVEDATAFTDWIHTCLSREHGKQIIDWLQKTCPKPYRHFEEHQASAIRTWVENAPIPNAPPREFPSIPRRGPALESYARWLQVAEWSEKDA